MRICHVTPHLPPDQAANALLPYHLGCWSKEAGDQPLFVAHPARQARTQAGAGRPSDLPLPGPVTWIPAESRGPAARALKVPGALGALRVLRRAGPSIAAADVVHVHSNGLLAEVCALAASRRGKPVVLTLYGTEIWHYRRRRLADLFTLAYRRASHVTFYSRGLEERAVELGLGRPGTSVVYPPVASDFQKAPPGDKAAARAALGLRDAHILVNVKRLHPLAGQRFLIEALVTVLRTHPGTRLVICGTGPLHQELDTLARSAGVDGHVTFAGLVDNRTVALYNMAADLFVLPSLLEACPTVALEALACGTPVVSSDNPGGVELNRLFGADVTVVPRENALALARAIVDRLDDGQGVRPSTTALIEQDFRPSAVAARFYAIYRAVTQGSAAARGSEGD